MILCYSFTDNGTASIQFESAKCDSSTGEIYCGGCIECLEFAIGCTWRALFDSEEELPLSFLSHKMMSMMMMVVLVLLLPQIYSHLTLHFNWFYSSVCGLFFALLVHLSISLSIHPMHQTHRIECMPCHHSGTYIPRGRRAVAALAAIGLYQMATHLTVISRYFSGNFEGGAAATASTPLRIH